MWFANRSPIIAAVVRSANDEFVISAPLTLAKVRYNGLEAKIHVRIILSDRAVVPK